MVLAMLLVGCGSGHEAAQTAATTSQTSQPYYYGPDSSPIPSPSPSVSPFPPVNSSTDCWSIYSGVLKYISAEQTAQVHCAATEYLTGAQTSFDFDLYYTGDTPNGYWNYDGCGIDIYTTGESQPTMILGYLGAGSDWGQALVNGAYVDYYLNCSYQ